MPQTLAVETLSPSQRSLLSQYHAGDEVFQITQHSGQIGAVPLTRWEVGLSGTLPGLSTSEGLGSAPRTFVKSEQRPSYMGRVTGPARMLLSIFDRWHVSDQDAALLLGCPNANYVSDLRVGTAGLDTRDIKDRARLLIQIYEGVHSVMREAAEERAWINSSLQSLNNRTVFGIMKDGGIADLLYAKRLSINNSYN